MNRKELKLEAKKLYKVDYWTFVGVYALYTLIIGALSGAYGVGLLILGGPISVGFLSYILNLKRNGNQKFNDLFSGFKRFSDYFVTFLLVSLYTFLWTLLFIVPGIIKSISYSQALYIIHDNPGMSPKEAIKKSQEMMKGHKMEYFVLILSFLGWNILNIFTLGILNIFFVGPYVNSTYALYYEKLIENDKPQENLDTPVEGIVE